MRILGIENYYATSEGVIWKRINRNHPERRQWLERKLTEDKDGYLKLRNRMVHRLIYETFNGPLVPGLVVAHKGAWS